MCSSTTERRPPRAAGSVLLEFALLLPLLVILVFGFAEIGRALHQQRLLTEAVLAGARYLSRAPDALDADCAPDAGWTAQAAAARAIIVFLDPSDPALPRPPRLPGLDAEGAVEFSSHRADAPGVTGCVVRVEAQVPFAAIFGDAVVPLLRLGRFDLTARTEERYIGD